MSNWLVRKAPSRNYLEPVRWSKADLSGPRVGPRGSPIVGFLHQQYQEQQQNYNSNKKIKEIYQLDPIGHGLFRITK